jgi:purine-binding chemotaxis protein CheW
MSAPRRTRTGPVDWQLVRERLARIEAAIAGTERLSPGQVAAVLEDRARALARVPPRQVDASKVVDVAAFGLAGEQYCIEARYVCEVTRVGELTPIPGAPVHLAGLLSLRGDVLSVFDLRTFFGVPTDGVTELSRVLVPGDARPEFGLLADAVFDVRSLRIADVHELPGTFAGAGREFLRGVTSSALIVVDGAALLRDPRLFIDQAEGRKAQNDRVPAPAGRRAEAVNTKPNWRLYAPESDSKHRRGCRAEEGTVEEGVGAIGDGGGHPERHGGRHHHDHGDRGRPVVQRRGGSPLRLPRGGGHRPQRDAAHAPALPRGARRLPRQLPPRRRGENHRQGA